MRHSTSAGVAYAASAALALLAFACSSSKFSSASAGGDDDDAGTTPPSAGSDGGASGSGDGGTQIKTLMPTSTSDGGDGDDGGTTTTTNSDDGGTTVIATNGHHPPTTPPTKTCTYTPDSDGFFTLTSSAGDYTVHLPASYDRTKPTAVMIGAHGCNDTAPHFCTWAMHPYNDLTNAFQSDTQNYISVSVEDSANDCWDYTHGSKITTALDDLATCFYVDQAHVTIAGYSSGAAAAYYVGLSNSERFDGILIEDGALYDTGSLEASLLAGVKWPINIGHMAHNSDPLYPLAQVEADWVVIKKAGFPLTELTEDGDHSGTYEDWSEKLAPLITSWQAPE